VKNSILVLSFIAIASHALGAETQPIITISCGTSGHGVAELKVKTSVDELGNYQGEFQFRKSDLMTYETFERRMGTDVIVSGNQVTLKPRFSEYPKVTVNLSTETNGATTSTSAILNTKLGSGQSWFCNAN
jgi:hypothetical protein